MPAAGAKPAIAEPLSDGFDRDVGVLSRRSEHHRVLGNLLHAFPFWLGRQSGRHDGPEYGGACDDGRGARERPHRESAGIATVPMKPPILPAAAAIRWHVVLAVTGKTSAGQTNVVGLGP